MLHLSCYLNTDNLSFLAKSSAESLINDENTAYRQRKAAKKAYDESLSEFKLHSDQKKVKIGTNASFVILSTKYAIMHL